MRHYLLESAQTETVFIKAKPLFFPVRFRLPEEMKEKISAATVRHYEGDLVFRFYCDPKAGDRITYKEMVWEVVRLDHTPQRRGSQKQDDCPIVITQFIGAAES
jgi:hypothetical protein